MIINKKYSQRIKVSSEKSYKLEAVKYFLSSYLSGVINELLMQILCTFSLNILNFKNQFLSNIPQSNLFTYHALFIVDLNICDKHSKRLVEYSFVLEK